MPPEDRRNKDRDRPNQGSVSPSNPDFAKWLDDLWDDGQSPQRIELVVLYANGTRAENKPIERQDYRGNPPRPNTEAIVALSNKFYGAAQRHCDVLGKPTRYQVVAVDERRSSEPVGRFPIKLMPRVEEQANEESEDGLGSDRLLRRINTIFEDDKWRVAQNAQATGDILRIFTEENERLRKHNNELYERCMSLAKQLEEAQSTSEDRALAREKQRFWLEQAGRGANTFLGLLPTVVNKYAGKNVLNGPPPEMLTIKNFLDGSTTEQKEAAFGRFALDGEKLIQSQPGVLSMEQAMIFDGVSTGKMQPEALLDLMDGGAYPITSDQSEKLQKIWSQEELIPLLLAFQEFAARVATAPKAV